MLKAGKTGRYYFTLHSEYKMREYHLSRQRVIRIIRSPKRTETGIVENTIAVMQPAGNVAHSQAGKPTWKQEIWVMYRVSNTKQDTRNKGGPPRIQYPISNITQPELRIISTWRYPGVSPERDPIPADILREITNRVDQDEEMA